MNINYKTQAMIRYLFNKELRKSNTEISQAAQLTNNNSKILFYNLF